MGARRPGSPLSSLPLLITGPCGHQTCRGALPGGGDSPTNSLWGAHSPSRCQPPPGGLPHLTDSGPLVPTKDAARPVSSPRRATDRLGHPPPPHTGQQRFPPHVRSPAHPEDLPSPQGWELPGFTALNSRVDTPNLKSVRIHPCESLKHVSCRLGGLAHLLISGSDLWPEPTPDHRDKDTLALRLKGEKEKRERQGTSLGVQWLRPRAPNAGGPGLIPGQGTRSRIPQLRPTRHSLINKSQCTNPIWISKLKSTWHPHSIDETMEFLITRSLPPPPTVSQERSCSVVLFSLITLRMRCAINTKNLAACLARRRKSS